MVEPYSITKEVMVGGTTELTSFFFRHGANVHALSYEREGARRHTLVDTGDSRYRDRMPSLLAENGIEPAGIERIIITHRHPDHCGLAHLLATESGASIMAHARFRDLVEGGPGTEERRWIGDFDPSRLRECTLEYLEPGQTARPVSIGGVDFPEVAGPIGLGEVGSIRILACPESRSMHSPDQLLVMYSSRSDPYEPGGGSDQFPPTDDVLFSGDLWLMKGPMYYRGISDIPRQVRFAFRRTRLLLSARSMLHRDPREQDSEAKEALKRGFVLVRVRPGHGEEFLGTRLVPRSLLADRDILLLLGYSLNDDTAILKSGELAPRLAAVREQGYASFVEELSLWRDMGYDEEDMAGLLGRVYHEQSGGGPLVEQDRQQRRRQMKAILARLRDDRAAAEELRRVAVSALEALSVAQ